TRSDRDWSSDVCSSDLGFGLLQRDRDFEHYQDLETHPERRASAWVEASGDWGAGFVELVEIPTPSDTNDNVVAYWVPQKAPKPEIGRASCRERVERRGG